MGNVQTADISLIDEGLTQLRGMAHSPAARVLLLLSEDARDEGRLQALQALAARAAKEALPVFREGANDPDAGVRAAALHGLYRIAPVESAMYWVRALHDENPGSGTRRSDVSNGAAHGNYYLICQL